jgi:hypothetical protein
MYGALIEGGEEDLGIQSIPKWKRIFMRYPTQFVLGVIA